MRIGVVAYEMEGAPTGVGRYLEGLLTGVARGGSDQRWLLFFKGDPFEHPLWSDPAEGGPVFEPIFDRRPGARPILWEQTRLPRLLRGAELDLLFSPANSLPRLDRGVPSVVTVHDLSFEHLGGEFPLKERWRRRVLARRAVRRARRVLTVSGASARDLADTYGLDPGKIGVVPNALDPRFLDRGGSSGEPDGARLGEIGVEPPYLLHLGSILARRRVDRVIAAFAAVAAEHPGLRLVLAGRNRLRRPRDLRRWLADAGCGERIVEVGYVPEEALAPLYRRAELTFYLSSFEGFGLPPLESLAAGTPAIVSPGQALDDLWPDYPYRCERLDLDAVAGTTRAVLADPEGRRAVVRQARERLAPLTWKRSAELLLAEIERAIRS